MVRAKRCANCGGGCGSKHDTCSNCRREDKKKSEHHACLKCGEQFLYFFKSPQDTCPECRRKASRRRCETPGCSRFVTDRRMAHCSICRDTEPVTLSLASQTAGDKSKCDSCLCAACANLLDCPMFRYKNMVELKRKDNNGIPVLIAPNRCNQVCGGNKDLYPITIAPELVFDREGVCHRDEAALAEEGPKLCPGFVLQEDLRP